jgi:peptide-N4-(N-acetyl-beta-glucosaminyl)asparagine amidase
MWNFIDLLYYAGCWLIYKVDDGQTCELEAYDLMSANDVPVRDPMDWYINKETCSLILWYLAG